MLPGIRFLFAAIVLSISILVFGLGAAALLRAAHEQFASNSSWRAGADATFAQQAEATRPALAMMRIEPLPVPPKSPDSVPTNASAAGPATATPTEQAIATPAQPAAIVSAPAEPEKIAAPKPEETSPSATAKTETAVSEAPAPAMAAPVSPDTAAVPAESKVSPSAAVSPSAEVLPSPKETAPAVSETIAATPAGTDTANSPQAGTASTKIATLGDPAVTTEPKHQAKLDSAKTDRSAIQKRQARRAAQRRGTAHRTRLAPQVAQQQSADPFAQSPSLAQPVARARKR